jgi:GDP/UDP-N,N'-diacetylbacillosamine 2-epimerase (hydrolysing)
LKKRKILAVTGIRSEYFFCRSIFQAIDASEELELGLVVTGAHLTPIHNYSVKDIEKDGLNIIAKLDTLLQTDHLSSRLKSSITQMQLLTHVIEQYEPDLLFAIADREEPIITAFCGAYLNIPVVHYCAGDRSTGNIDSTIRQSVSDIAQILLTTCDDSSQRLIKRGEEPWRIHNVGFSGLDRIRATKDLEMSELEQRLGIPSGELQKPYIVVVQHPISSQVEQAHEQMEKTMRSIAKFIDINFVVSNPNTDAGSSEIRQVIQEYSKLDNIFTFSNIEDELFVNLLRNAKGLIGNSSMGVYEAPFYNLPVLNIGRRQIGRHHGDNITYIDNIEADIVKGIEDIINLQERKFINPFGDGTTAQKVVEILSSVEINETLLNKKLTY